MPSESPRSLTTVSKRIDTNPSLTRIQIQRTHPKAMTYRLLAMLFPKATLSLKAQYTLRWTIRAFLVYYVVFIFVPFLLSLLSTLPYLFNMQCGPTLSMLLSLHTDSPLRKLRCSVGREQLAISYSSLDYEDRIPTTSSPQTQGKTVAWWCDAPRSVLWSVLWGNEQCHYAVREGMYQVDIPQTWVPSLRGFLMFAMFMEAWDYFVRSKKGRKG